MKNKKIRVAKEERKIKSFLSTELEYLIFRYIFIFVTTMTTPRLSSYTRTSIYHPALITKYIINKYTNDDDLHKI